MNKLALGLAVILGVLLYLRSPIDLVPDRIGALGLLDDLLALGIAAWWFWKRFPNVSSGAGAGSTSSRSVGGEESRGRFDPYETLGLSRDASADDLRRAYHEKLRQYHPDKVDSLGEELQKVAHGKTLDIRRAYDELKDRL